MASSHPTNLFYAQSGGVTAVINATAAAVIEQARYYPEQFQSIFAGHHGILGALHEQLYDTRAIDAADLQCLMQTPGGLFGSCRYKLPAPEVDSRPYQRLLEVFRQHQIGYFLYNGGNDSQDTAYKLSLFAKANNWPLKVIGIPKTIDNDLYGTDCSPGFGSVAKYVATSILEASLDLRAMYPTSTKVFIMEVMGRHAGWIAAASAMAQRQVDDPPHLILFPERPVNPEWLLKQIQQIVDRVGFCVICASEGAKDHHNQWFAAQAQSKDAFGHVQLGGCGHYLGQLVSKHLNLRQHVAVCDYLQRSARHLASRTDLEQSIAVGKGAVEALIKGHHNVMIGIERLQDLPYRWQLKHIPLAEVANQERVLPDKFIAPSGVAVTDACRAYLRGLIEGESYPSFSGGVPAYLQATYPLVTPKLASWKES